MYKQIRHRSAIFRNMHYPRCDKTRGTAVSQATLIEPLIQSHLSQDRTRFFRKAERVHTQRRIPKKRRTGRLREVYRIAIKAIKQGKYKTEIEPYLTEKEKNAIDAVVFKGQVKCSRLSSVSDNRFTIYSTVCSLLQKLKNWENGNVPGLSKNFRLRYSIHYLIARRLEKGEKLEDIKEKAKLNKTDSKIINCLMRNLRMRTDEIAKRIQRSEAAVSISLKRTENKLLGKDPYGFEKRKYLEKSDDFLRKAIRAIQLSGAKTRLEAYRENRGLCSVAKDRGIIYEFYPVKKSKFLEKAEHEVRKQLREKPLKEIIKVLAPLEIIILKERILGKNLAPTNIFCEKYNIKDAKELELLTTSIIRKIKGLPSYRITGITMKIRIITKRLGKEKMRRFREHSTKIELSILDNRADKNKGIPKTLENIGNKYGYCKEGVRLIEKKLLKRLEEYERTGKIPPREKRGRKPKKG